MRSRAQVRHQLKQVSYRHLQKRLRKLFQQRPDTCLFNYQVHLEGDVGVHLCGALTAQGVPRNVPCDDRMPGCLDMARECPLWVPLQTKEEVKAAFKELLKSVDRGQIAAEFPDIAALLWVLDDPENADLPTEDEVDEAVEEVAEPGSMWANIKRRLSGGAR